jgi:hypothetical protein
MKEAKSSQFERKLTEAQDQLKKQQLRIIELEN